MRRLLVLTAAASAAALLLPVLPLSAASAAPAAVLADGPPPNERDPGGDGEAPWLTRAGKDMTGYRLSTYTGRFYEKSREQYRLCVVQRESGGNYDEASGEHRGAYQMSSALADQALGAMRAEVRSAYGERGLAALGRLDGRPISSWPRFWQDMAFWTILDHGAGWQHWSSQWGANWDCDHRPNAEKGWPSPDHPNYSRLEGPRGQRAAERAAPDVTTAKCCRPEVTMRMARLYIKDTYGWGREHFLALKEMWWKESNWRYDVVNNHPNGPWYGLGQVNGPYIEAQGFTIKEYMASPRKQIIVGCKYIKERYGTPVKAWDFWQANGWY
ncbi:MAG: hypothetical protein ACKOT0_08300 [bacterium]